jgi:PleD family two-component response regulator
MEKDIIATSKILIVDDQDANVLLLERLLQHAGYKNYLSLTDSRGLLDQYRLFQPDLIILDLMMPKLDGYAVMKQLAGWLPSDVYLPILIVTADVSKTARQKALTLGAKDFITKPIDATETTLRIYNLLLTRWLYRQMEIRSRHCVEQAGESKRRIATALREMEELALTGPLLPDHLTGLRAELRRALDAMTMLASAEAVTPDASFVEKAS